MKINNAARFFIFGTGSSAEYLFQNLRPEITVLGFLDNNPLKQGTVFYGYPVINPENLKNQDFDYIAIASQYHAEIYNQLITLNVPKEKIFNQSDHRTLLSTPQFDQEVEQFLKNAKTFVNKDYSIGIVLPFGFILGGVETWSFRLYKGLKQENKKVVLVRNITNNSGPNYQEVLFDPSYDYVDCNCCGEKYDDSLVNLFAAYKKLLPAVIIPNSSYESFLICMELKKRIPEYIRVLYVLHSDTEFVYDMAIQFKKDISGFVCVSHEIENKLLKKIPDRTADIRTMISPTNISVKNRSYSKENEPIKLCYSGRVVEQQKRSYDLYNLILHLEERQVDFSLEIVGGGDYYQTLVGQVDSLNPITRAKVKFIPSVSPEQMEQIWSNVDVFVNVSEFEGTSISMIEAMGQGVVPVVTDVSGVKLFIDNGKNGFIVPIGDTKKMAEQIAFLEKQKHELVTMGDLSKKRVKELCFLNDYINGILKITDQMWL